MGFFFVLFVVSQMIILNLLVNEPVHYCKSNNVHCFCGTHSDYRFALAIILKKWLQCFFCVQLEQSEVLTSGS